MSEQPDRERFRRLPERVMPEDVVESVDTESLPVPDGSRLTELAEAAQVTKQTASHLVDRLERTGYVRRTPDPTDARARLVRAAARGLAAKPVAEAVVAEVEAEWRAHLGDRRWRQLRDALTSLREITDPYR